MVKKDTIEGKVRHACVDYNENGESYDEWNGKVKQTESHAHKRPQRRRQVPRRFENYELFFDNIVSNVWDLIHFFPFGWYRANRPIRRNRDQGLEWSYEKRVEVNWEESNLGIGTSNLRSILLM